MGDAFGGGVMVAIAAVLWVAYLLPSWLHRRQYLATERNAVRLQQTLRILAETAETPEQVRVEATARAAASQERVLRDREAAERARMKAEEETAAIERRSAERAAAEALRRVRASVEAPRARARMLRRMRATASIVLLTSLAITGVGVTLAVVGQGWVLAAAGVVGTVGSIALLNRFARVSRRQGVAVRPAAVVPATSFAPVEWAADEAPAAAGWTPRPMPKPLSQSPGSIAAVAMDSAEAAAALRRAAVFAAMSQRAAEINESPVTVLRPVATAAPAASARAASSAPADAAAPSAFASMGIVDAAGPGMGDLDAVLRRRRAS
jgi:hypothetical protein